MIYLAFPDTPMDSMVIPTKSASAEAAWQASVPGSVLVNDTRGLSVFYWDMKAGKMVMPASVKNLPLRLRSILANAMYCNLGSTFEELAKDKNQSVRLMLAKSLKYRFQGYVFEREKSRYMVERMRQLASILSMDKDKDVRKEIEEIDLAESESWLK